MKFISVFLIIFFIVLNVSYAEQVGDANKYHYLMFNNYFLPSYSAEIDLTSGNIGFYVRSKIVASCQSQELNAYLKLILSNSGICLQHNVIQSGYGCTLLYSEGYAQLYNKDSQGKIYDAVNLGGDLVFFTQGGQKFPAVANECHPQVDFCDSSVKSQLSGFWETWKNNNFRPSPHISDLKCDASDLVSVLENVPDSCSDYINGKMTSKYLNKSKEYCEKQCLLSNFVGVSQGQLECRWVASNGTIETFRD